MGLVIGAAITLVSYQAMLLREDRSDLDDWRIKGIKSGWHYVIGGAMYFATVFAAIRTLEWNIGFTWANAFLTPIWHLVMLRPTMIPTMLSSIMQGKRPKFGPGIDTKQNDQKFRLSVKVADLDEEPITSWLLEMEIESLVLLLNKKMLAKEMTFSKVTKWLGFDQKTIENHLRISGYIYSVKKRQFLLKE